MSMVKKMAQEAKAASLAMSQATTGQKKAALRAMIEELSKERQAILEANRLDVLDALQKGLSEAMIERLSLEKRWEGLLHDIEMVAKLEDPVGELLEERVLQNGLRVARCRIPLGVVGVIFESRPNVTLDCSALCLLSGNCALLRGGSETLRTNRLLVGAIQRALVSCDLPEAAIQLLSSGERSEVKELLEQHASIDLIIPRGGLALQRFCREESKIPVVTGGIGICHLFVDESADLARSLEVVLNAKTQRPTVCNALDTLLVHEKVAPLFLPQLFETPHVSFRLDERAFAWAKGAACSLAQEGDWDTEWLSLVLGVKIVDNIDEALLHIRKHSTGHSDGILTESDSHAERFLREVDAAAVYVNTSTRFTDGGQLGLGAEVAISTQKLHARGPMGLKELTSSKWIVHGNYQVRG